MFIELLQQTCERFKLKVTCFCLMPNHYHFLAQTPLANLSRCMAAIDGAYSLNDLIAYMGLTDRCFEVDINQF